MKKCIDTAISLKIEDYGIWLFDKCRKDIEFKDQTKNGYRNSGNYNTGFFNSKTPENIMVFNKPCTINDWIRSSKPGFIHFDTNIWISTKNMSDQEKIDNPNFYVSDGYLKKIPYKEAWQKSWDTATTEDKELLFKLPNFDADIFKEITGIDVNK